MSSQNRKRTLTEWQNERFGMFIHWGLYAITARDMWYYSVEKVPQDTYEKLAGRFNPVDYDPAEWAKLAVEAGMKYSVMIAKHHDGYCLFNSKLTKFSSMYSPCKRDLIRDWVKAFRAAGLGTGLYYSLLDWHHPNFTIDRLHPQRENAKALAEKRNWPKYVEYLHGQVRELMTNYGKINIFWPDFHYKEKDAKAWESEKLLKTIRKLQPQILSNDRLGIPADFTTPEQFVPQAPPKKKGKLIPWETCMTIGQSWGYYRQDPTNKTTPQLIRTLVDCVSKNGNFLLNVGPTPRGTIQDEFIVQLKQIGKWMRMNGESIYGAGMSKYTPPMDCRYTQRGDKLYLHVFNWFGGEVPLAGLYGKVEYATLLRDGTDLTLRSSKRKLSVVTPAHAPDPYCTVIELQLT